jgi:hypothetical protein
MFIYFLDLVEKASRKQIFSLDIHYKQLPESLKNPCEFDSNTNFRVRPTILMQNPPLAHE